MNGSVGGGLGLDAAEVDDVGGAVVVGERGGAAAAEGGPGAAPQPFPPAHLPPPPTATATATASIERWMGFWDWGIVMAFPTFPAALDEEVKGGQRGLGGASPLGVAVSRVDSAFLFNIAFVFIKIIITCLGRFLLFCPPDVNAGLIVIELE